MSHQFTTSPHKQATSPNEFGERYGVSIATVFRLIRDRKLQACKIGRRTIITAEAEAKWLASLPHAGSAK
jgi:hypothetical protein